MERRKFVGAMAAVAAIPLVKPGQALGKLTGELASLDRTGSATAQTKQEVAAFTQEVMTFTKAFSEASATKDRGKLSGMISDDFVFTSPNGQTRNKTDMLDEVTQFGSFGIGDIAHEIKINGRTAIIAGTFNMAGTGFKGTQTLVKQPAGNWLAVASSVTRASAKKARQGS